MSYDAVGRRVGVEDALGSCATALYNAIGQTSANVDPAGYRTTTFYDADGRSVATMNALSQLATTTYDSVGQAIASIDPLGHRVTTYYLPDREQATANAPR